MSGTVTLAEKNENGGRFVLKEITEESLPIYRRISELTPHENLMQVHEIIRQDGKITAVCEFAEGKPLDELLESGRAFPISEIRHITLQLCRAAEQLHHNGIIHRDITPKNIILDENLNLTLIDYGISRLFTGNREQDTTLYGTEGFAPPEQYGFRETRFTADIYAIGVVMKLLLNICPNCPPTQEVLLRKIAAKCTQFVPEERFKSAAAVRRAVSRSQRILPMGIAAVSMAVTAGVIAAVLIFLNVNSDPPPISKVQQLPITSVETTASSTAQTITPPVETTVTTTAQTAATTARTTASTTAQTAATTARTTATTTTQTAATTARTTAATTIQTTATTARTTAT
ncbi:MAG: serine/threonine protein kinase, partial [Oscillospiraceae bacterium]